MATSFINVSAPLERELCKMYCKSDIPSYWDFFNKTIISFKEFGLRSDKYPYDFQFIINLVLSIKMVDVFSAMCFAAMFSLLRLTATSLLYKPLASYVGIRPKDVVKFQESLWKLLYNSVLWSMTCYCLIFSGRHHFFTYPLLIWADHNYDGNTINQVIIPTDIYWIYMIQIGLYIHSLYATFFLDAWKKDSIMMFFHHLLTIFLLEFSYLMKYYQIGCLVLFLHDISDVLLQITKLCIYLKNVDNKWSRIFNLLSSISFISFMISWCWFRLYWYPLKVIHATNWGVYITQIDNQPKLYVFFNVMLWCLQGLHIYWFYFIMILFYKIVSGKAEVVDNREYEDS